MQSASGYVTWLMIFDFTYIYYRCSHHFKYACIVNGFHCVKLGSHSISSQKTYNLELLYGHKRYNLVFRQHFSPHTEQVNKVAQNTVISLFPEGTICIQSHSGGGKQPCRKKCDTGLWRPTSWFLWCIAFWHLAIVERFLNLLDLFSYNFLIQILIAW